MDNGFGGFILGVVAVLVVAGLFAIPSKRVTDQETAPCEKFATYRIQNVPARCLNHFMVNTNEAGR